MVQYFRPVIQIDAAEPEGAVAVAGGWCWFEWVEVLERNRKPQMIPVGDVPTDVLSRACSRRSNLAGLDLRRPRLMGILNSTPDSFSDGGEFEDRASAIFQAENMIRQGADILDIGGESTRPGAEPVPVQDEIDRVEPVISAIAENFETPVSIDTRKAEVASAAIAAGARIINDVSALCYDNGLARVAAVTESPVCLMHSLADPRTMQDAPHYDHVLLDVYDHLSDRIEFAVANGVDRKNIIVDPGIGFGKTDGHNTALMRGLGLFHTLGCPILLGASRKSLIGRIGDAPDPMSRFPGSVALALAGMAQGVQIMRVHDIAETKQAVRLWQAATGKGQSE